MLMVVMISKKIQQWRPFVMRCPNVRVHYIGASLNKCGQAATVAGTNQKTLETFLLRCAFWDNFIILFLIPQHS